MKTMQDAMGDLAGLKRAIEASDFDAIVATSPESVRYISDVLISSQSSIRDRLAYIVWAKGRDPVFILCQVEEGYVRQESWIQDMRPFKEFVTAPTDILIDLLKELGLESGRVGLEMEYLAAVYFNKLSGALPGLRLEPCEGLIRSVRMFKTQRELDALTRGFQGTANAMLETYATVKVGEDEWSLKNRLADAIQRSGADRVAFNHINAGPNTGFPHAGPSNYQVQKGDIVKADSGGYYDEYMSNIGRTAKVGPPTAEDKEIWKKLRDIHHEIIDMLRPGNTGRQLFERATVLHEKAGIPFPFAHNGHSIGLEVHEHPLISPHENLSYEPGMVSTVETRVRWVGKVGYHMEDLVLITEGSPVLLSTAFDNEEILVI